MKAKLLSCILTGLALIPIVLPVELVHGQGSFMLSAEAKLEFVPPIPRSRPSGDNDDSITEGAVPEICSRCRKPKGLPNPGKQIAKSCHRQFLKKNGKYGDVGRKIATLITSKTYRPHFLADNALSEVCPKYSGMSEDERVKAWVWFWMVLANEESDCNPDQPHPTHLPDGRRLNPRPGWGLFAAELHKSHRRWRGSMCQGDIKKVDVQVNCAVDTMASAQLDQGRGVLWSESYWGPVRRSEQKILPNMGELKACF